MKKLQFIGKTSVKDNIRLTENPRYPVFKDIYTKQKKAVWFPEELNIQQDVLDYKSLSPTEKDLFDTSVGYFASSELLVQNVLGNGFFPVLTDPYAKMSFSTQMFMENIHSDFFEIILNTFEMDRKRIYNITLEDKLLHEKQELIIRAVDRITYGKADPDTLEGKKQILTAILLNNIIQEGMFFYSAFAHFFAMKDTGKMKNVVSGVELILIDESLHLQNGIEAILTIVEENPEIVDDEKFVDNIRETIIDAVELELNYLKTKFGGTTIFGVSYKELEKYMKYIADRRLEELGFDPQFKIDQNPLKFLQKEDVKKLTNFFEVSSTEYTNF
ncbi:ribonucleotide-diphosphate reductase subunit beta [Persephonella atlantica]|uniref:Ribonucleoside-diphosphate reductase subunit beta n=1 Tax=Persephonella atlantica TaxID=2699429 RepID=A0ABS1GJG1_9AQUI|nr:ribonucleotide-diphosphate reductase subunit beta [Persephonella atlantica]MBK3333040.1 ribonucleotide-diphosphate reductase subunit beta [Persephonella atlantica]